MIFVPGFSGEKLVRNLGKRASFGNQARVRRFYSIHIRPDHRLLRAERSAENGGRIVRAPAPERGLNALGSRGDETGDDGDNALVKKRTQTCFSARPRWRHQRLRAAVMWIGDNHLGGGNSDAAQAELADRACNKKSRETLADSGDGVERARRQLMNQRRSTKEPVRFV